ncbi:phage terminase large subunit, partial [Holdemania filiformis]|uniref:phage terminase large subunit n=1 Tax=Holdemania filiformis TaxID=61171 RepID=UPI00248EB899
MSKEIRISDLIIPKFREAFNDTEHTHLIITLGRAGTKSSFGGIRDIYKIISDDNCSTVVMRKFHNKLKKTVYKETLRGIHRLGLNKKRDFKITVSPMEIQYKKNGNTIYFTGNDSIDDTKGMIDESKPIKRVVIDELTEFF